MSIDKIHELLDRYMEGTNTQEELQELKAFFSESTSLPEELLPYHEMFEMLDTPLPEPTDEELTLFCQINDVEPAAEPENELLDAPKDIELKPKIIFRRIVPWLSAACIAAVFMLLYTPEKEQRDHALHARLLREYKIKQDEKIHASMLINNIDQNESFESIERRMISRGAELQEANNRFYNYQNY